MMHGQKNIKLLTYWFL